MNAPMDTFDFSRTSSDPVIRSVAQKFSRYDHAILKHVWTLNIKTTLLLDYQQTYLTTAGKIASLIRSEKYPHFYEDTIDHVEGERSRNGHPRYFVSYLFCSGLFLEDLSHNKPETPIAIQFRENTRNNFYYCLIRPWDRSWIESNLLANGAKKLP
jgi:hypothetical protein